MPFSTDLKELLESFNEEELEELRSIALDPEQLLRIRQKTPDELAAMMAELEGELRQIGQRLTATIAVASALGCERARRAPRLRVVS